MQAISCTPGDTNNVGEVRLLKAEEMIAKLEDTGLDVLDFDARWNRYRIRLPPANVKKHQEILAELFEQTYRQTAG